MIAYKFKKRNTSGDTLSDLNDDPVGKNIVNCKVVYKLKFKADGTVDRYEARIVAMGFRQIHVEDYDKVFAPVAHLTTIRIVIIIFMHYDIVPRHLDVKTAFLHAKLKHDIYIRLPAGILIGGKSYWRLKKSLYGLKQAAHDWRALQEDFILEREVEQRRTSLT